jgi:hypothetical protein
VVDGETGFLVEPDSIRGLVAASTVGEIDRRRAAGASRTYSVAAFARRVDAWLDDVSPLAPRRIAPTLRLCAERASRGSRTKAPALAAFAAVARILSRVPWRVACGAPTESSRPSRPAECQGI